MCIFWRTGYLIGVWNSRSRRHHLAGIKPYCFPPAENGHHVRIGGRHSTENEGVLAPEPRVQGQDVGREGHLEALRPGQGGHVPTTWRRPRRSDGRLREEDRGGQHVWWVVSWSSVSSRAIWRLIIAGYSGKEDARTWRTSFCFCENGWVWWEGNRERKGWFYAALPITVLKGINSREPLFFTHTGTHTHTSAWFVVYTSKLHAHTQKK